MCHNWNPDRRRSGIRNVCHQSQKALGAASCTVSPALPLCVKRKPSGTLSRFIFLTVPGSRGGYTMGKCSKYTWMSRQFIMVWHLDQGYLGNALKVFWYLPLLKHGWNRQNIEGPCFVCPGSQTRSPRFSAQFPSDWAPTAHWLVFNNESPCYRHVLGANPSAQPETRTLHSSINDRTKPFNSRRMICSIIYSCRGVTPRLLLQTSRQRFLILFSHNFT